VRGERGPDDLRRAWVGKSEPSANYGACGAASTAGYTVLFVAAPALVAQLAKAYAEGRLEEKPTHFTKPELLIVGELG